MQSPKSKKRPWTRESKYKKVWPKREHTNQKFYMSKAWRDFRKAYISALQQRVWAMDDIYLQSLPYVPCECCMRLYKVRAYDKVDEGVELHHIDPVNPKNALDCKGYGQPFPDYEGLDFLCKHHHSRRRKRDKRVLKLRTGIILIIIIISILLLT